VQIRELSVPDAYEVVPAQHGDDRGVFLEWFARDRFEKDTGHRLPLAQANCSVSSRGVVRGVHFADVPPGQAKYVTCAAGTVLDVVVDLRVGAPTFGRWEAVRLDDVEHRALFLAEGLGHAFMSLSDKATLVYLCSEQYNPQGERGVHPMDPDLGIQWPGRDLARLSPKDADAASVKEATAHGLLPTYAACRDLYASRAS
jgi:dTDP-4-dehydrorhamnose 3,5-epimerase